MELSPFHYLTCFFVVFLIDFFQFRPSTLRWLMIKIYFFQFASYSVISFIPGVVSHDLD